MFILLKGILRVSSVVLPKRPMPLQSFENCLQSSRILCKRSLTTYDVTLAPPSGVTRAHPKFCGSNVHVCPAEGIQFFTFTWLKEETQVAPTLEDFRDTAHYTLSITSKAKPLSSRHTSRLCAGLVEPEPTLCEGFSSLFQLQLKEEEEKKEGPTLLSTHLVQMRLTNWGDYSLV